MHIFALLQAMASELRQTISTTSHVQDSFSLCKETQTCHFQRENMTLSRHHSLFVSCFCVYIIMPFQAPDAEIHTLMPQWQQYDSTESKRQVRLDFCHSKELPLLEESFSLHAAQRYGNWKVELAVWEFKQLMLLSCGKSLLKIGNLDYPQLFVMKLHTRAGLVSVNGKIKCWFLDYCLTDK